MAHAKTVLEWMAERHIEVADLVSATGLPRRVLDAIMHNRYTPSPQQRQALAVALGVELTHIIWGHSSQVDPMYGHGPQFGRSP
jgi:hypothetical protein